MKKSTALLKRTFHFLVLVMSALALNTIPAGAQNVAPSITCPGTITANTAADLCNVVVNYDTQLFVTGSPAPTLQYTFSGVTTTPSPQPGSGSGQTFNKGITTVTITATNGSGSASCSFLVQVFDMQGPNMNCLPAMNVVCLSDVPDPNGQLEQITGTDNCGGPITVTWAGDVLTPGSCANQFSILRTFNCTDDAGNVTVCALVITVNDNVPPVLSLNPSNTTVQCNAIPVAPTVTATDGCSGTTPVTFTETSTKGTNPALCSYYNYTLSRTWTSVDPCGNLTRYTQTIHVVDNTKPSFTRPANTTIFTNANCNYNADPSITGNPTNVTDNCSTILVPTYSDVVTNGPCTGSKSIARTWHLADACGNTAADQVQTITVSDNIPPALTGTPTTGTQNIATCKPAQAAAAAAFNAPAALQGYTDNCSTTLTATLTSTLVTGSNCAWTVTYTYSVNDACGNALTGQTYSNSGGSLAPPVLVNSNSGCSTLNQSGIAQSLATAQNFDPHTLEVAVAALYKDACSGGTVTASWLSTTPGANNSNCNWSFVYTYNIKDACNNTVTCSVTYNGGSAPPSITCPGTITVNTALNLCTAVVIYDNQITVTGNPVLTYVFTGATLTPSPQPGSGSGQTFNKGTTTVTITATGTCGSVSCSFNIIVEDHQGPDVSCPAALNEPCTDNVPDPASQLADIAANSSDNCGGTVTVTWEGDDVTPGTCLNRYSIIRHFKALDQSGNPTFCAQQITVNDNVPPVLSQNPANTTISCSAAIPAVPNITATDQCSGTTPTVVFSTSNTQGNNPNQCSYYNYTITRTWSAADVCGNSTNYTQVITVRDNTKPTFTRPPDITIYTDANCNYNSSVAITGDVTNEADNCSPNLQATFTDVVSNGSCPGAKTILRTWSLVDLCGNTAANQVQTITVTDATAPVWTTAAGSLNRTVECSDANGLSAAQALSPVATDNCSTVSYAKTSGAFIANTPCIASGTYTNSWVATDACGNTSTVFTQVITVQDHTAPVWTTAAGNLNRTVECSDANGLSAAQALSPVATDNCSTVTYAKTSGAFIANTPCIASGTYTNTWVATDACGNTSTVFTQVITVQDHTSPVWTTAAGNLNRTVECSDANGLAAAQALSPVATDNCSTVTYAKTSGAFIANTPCIASGTYTNSWVATDACGNTSTVFTQVITVQDHTAPVWTTAAGNLNRTVECSDANGLAAAQALSPVATDNCSTVSYAKTSGTFIANTPCIASGTYTNTWVATDACGNTSTVFTQVITVQDHTAPVWTTAAGNLNRTVECSDANGLAAAQALSPVATDNCSTVSYAKTSGTFIANTPCIASGTYTNTWVATDACGNTSTVFTQVITVQDHTSPVWTTAAGNLNRTVECSDANGLAAAQALSPVATDNCSTVSYAKTSGAFIANTPCIASGTYTNTWVATDACGNTSTVYTQVITVQDHTSPVWTTAAGSLNRTVECSDANGLAAAQALSPVATDNCSTVSYAKTSGTFIANTPCIASGTYTNTWVATDACGNTSTVFTQVITVQDHTSPVWTTAAGNLNRTVECSDANGLAAAQALSPVATDNCSTVSYAKTSGTFIANTPCIASGTYTNSWVATDACGNTSTVYTQVITVQDHTSPVWTTAAGNLNRTVECSDANGLAAAQALSPVATDNCSTVSYAKTSGTFIANTPCIASGTYTNTWVATDACGNTSTVYTQVITVQDHTAPVWTTAAGNLNRTVECSDANGLAAAQALSPVATDNCSTVSYAKTSGAFIANTPCIASGTYTNTWVATDACGNTSTVFTQVITVQDHTAPVWTTAAGNLNRTVECSDANGLSAAQALSPVATDNCSTVSYAKTSGTFIANTPCIASGTYTNSWVATDACGNTSTVFTQVITVQDHTAPVWTTAAGSLNRTVECSDANGLSAAQALSPVATDNCSTVTYAKTSGAFIANTPCIASGTYTNTWVATDACGNTSTVYTQVITVQDHTAPVWTTAAGNLNRTVECSDANGLAAAQALSPVATDNCSTVSYAKTSGTFIANTPCIASGTYTNTWVATDACGNTSTVFTQVITVQDHTAPVWTTAAGNLNRTVECSDANGLAAAQALSPVATDNCSTVTYAKTSGAFIANTPCIASGTYTNTWVATDACGNTSTVFTQVITVQDHTAPVWTTAAGNLNRTVECSDANGLAAAQALSPVATDNCSTVTYAKTSGAFIANTPCIASGTYTNSWVATDACGNTSTVFTQVITVQDHTSPVWTTAAGNLNRTVECSDANGLAAAQALSPVATDNCSTVSYAKTSGAFIANTPCIASGTYTNTWVATDACGNTSTVYTQVITVQDHTAPVWTTAAGNLNRTVECSDANGLAAAQALSPVATDNCSTVTYAKTSGAFIANTPCIASGTYTNTWVATDACGNTSTVFTQVITVQDHTAPVWTTAAGNLNRTVECSDANGLAAAQALSPVATDNCSTVSYAKTSGTFIANTPCIASGTYTNSWVATDACGNTSTVFTQVITVQDHTSPVWTTAAGNLNRTVECSDANGLAAAQALSPVATDNCSTVSYAKTSGTFIANTPCIASGTYTNSWVATDACGNTSTVYTQVITVQDHTSPVWTTAAGNLNRTVECSDANGLAAAQALSPVATDNCSTVSYAKTSGTFIANTPCIASGTYTNTWVATDACGNTSTVYTQVITVQDHTAPVWTTAAGNLNRTVECSDANGLAAAQALSPVATDNCSTVSYAKTSGAFIANTPCIASGTYTNTWVATDACGNTSTVFTQVITVQDHTAPVWTTAAGNLNRTVECSDANGLSAAQALSPVATDNCSTVSYAKTSGTFIANTPCIASGTYTNSWVATDACGNTSTVFTQVITVQDHTAPVWTTAAGSLNRTVECSDANGLSAAQALSPVATDNCSTVTYAKTSGAFIANTPCIASGTYTNTWVATDACGNTSTVYTQVITVQDHTAPVWTTAAGSLNRTVECSDANGLSAAQALSPVATDNCSTVTYAKTSGAFIANTPCIASGTYTNTWVATDACGNTSTVYTQVITVQDHTAPVWTTAAGNLNRTVECSDANGLAAAQALSPVATDNCSTVTYAKTSGAFVPGSCGSSGTYTNTWVAKDACQNASTVFTQVITLQDVTPPVLINPNVGCSSLNQTGLIQSLVTAQAFNGQTLASAVAALYKDNCTGTVTAVLISSTPGTNNSNCNWSFVYTFSIKDPCQNATTCSVTYSGHMATLTLGTCSSTNINCSGGSTGSVTAGAVNNPVTYTWKNASGTTVGTTATVSGLAAGTYTLTVTDGCSTLTCTVTISQTGLLTATTSQVNVQCNASTGSATVTASGGSGNYVYVWKNSSGQTIGTAATVTGLGAGTYTVTVTDASNSGCSVTKSVTITSTNPVSAYLGNLSNYLWVLTNGSIDANWQGSSNGFIGDVALNGLVASERSSGYVPYAGTIYTNDKTLSQWQSIINSNSCQSAASFNQTSLISGLNSNLENAFSVINSLPVTPGYDNMSTASLNNLNTQNGIPQTIVINVTSGFQVTNQIKITGDASDLFIFRWDTDKNFANGYNGQVKFQSGGAIVPLGGLTAANFIHVAGDISSSGGGGNPPSPYPQGPRTNNGAGSLITGGTNFNGGGFFTGYWLTTGAPTIFPSSGQPYGPTQSLSNGVFVGGWYTKTSQLSQTSGCSGVYVGCATPTIPHCFSGVTGGSPSLITPVATKGDFSVNAYPNPSTSDFNLVVNSGNTEPVTVRIIDMNGIVKAEISQIAKSNVIKVGSNLIGGTYMAEVTQGKNRAVVKLIKLN